MLHPAPSKFRRRGRGGDRLGLLGTRCEISPELPCRQRALLPASSAPVPGLSRGQIAQPDRRVQTAHLADEARGLAGRVVLAVATENQPTIRPSQRQRCAIAFPSQLSSLVP